MYVAANSLPTLQINLYTPPPKTDIQHLLLPNTTASTATYAHIHFPGPPQLAAAPETPLPRLHVHLHLVRGDRQLGRVFGGDAAGGRPGDHGRGYQRRDGISVPAVRVGTFVLAAICFAVSLLISFYFPLKPSLPLAFPSGPRLPANKLASRSA